MDKDRKTNEIMCFQPGLKKTGLLKVIYITF
jgi:hypothetical protein